jgi:SHS2 domain-containing protein
VTWAVSGEVVARGASLQHAFIEAVVGLFSCVVDPAVVEAREVREVRAHGDSPEALLAHWIDECCYLHEVEGFVFRTIDLVVFDVEPRVGGEAMRLHALLHGETVDPVRHRTSAPAISVDPADIETRRNAEGYEIRVMFRTDL